MGYFQQEQISLSVRFIHDTYATYGRHMVIW